VRWTNVDDDFDLEDYIVNLIAEQVKILASSFGVNRDRSMEEQILALNANERMLDLSHLKEMSPTMKNKWNIFIFLFMYQL
jgi:hypothetical protein